MLKMTANPFRDQTEDNKIRQRCQILLHTKDSFKGSCFPKSISDNHEANLDEKPGHSKFKACLTVHITAQPTCSKHDSYSKLTQLSHFCSTWSTTTF